MDLDCDLVHYFLFPIIDGVKLQKRQSILIQWPRHGEEVLGQYCDSGEDVSVNTDRYPEKLGAQYGQTAEGRRSVLDPNFEG